jgi:hypothetical protein
MDDRYSAAIFGVLLLLPLLLYLATTPRRDVEWYEDTHWNRRMHAGASM